MSSAALILESNEPSEPERIGNVSSGHPRPWSAESGVASPVDDEDMAIVLALRRGESGAAEALFRRLVPYVRRTLWRILRNPVADCDDLIQITFERIINTLIDGRYRGACSLPRWAMSIASHAAVDHHRARCRERKLLDAEIERSFDGGAPPTADAERSLIARSELVRLKDTLSRMRPLDAQALMLRHGFGFSLAETAAALGTSEYAVASRLARARRELSRRTSHLRDGE